MYVMFFLSVERKKKKKKTVCNQTRHVFFSLLLLLFFSSLRFASVIPFEFEKVFFYYFPLSLYFTSTWCHQNSNETKRNETN